MARCYTPEEGKQLADHFEALKSHLQKIGVFPEWHHHERVYTVAEAQEQTGHLQGTQVKNLFVKDKKEHFWLITCQEETEVHLKSLARKVGAKGGLRLASEEVLLETLGVLQGSVSPLALLYNREHSNNVQFVVEPTLLEQDTLLMHPCDNSFTVSIVGQDFQNFLQSIDVEPLVVSVTENSSDKK